MKLILAILFCAGLGFSQVAPPMPPKGSPKKTRTERKGAEALMSREESVVAPSIKSFTVSWDSPFTFGLYGADVMPTSQAGWVLFTNVVPQFSVTIPNTATNRYFILGVQIQSLNFFNFHVVTNF